MGQNKALKFKRESSTMNGKDLVFNDRDHEAGECGCLHMYIVHEIQDWDMASVKFYSAIFEIAVDKQTRAATGDRNFKRVPDTNRQTMTSGQRHPCLIQIRPDLTLS